MIAKSILCIITVFIVSSAALAKGYEAGNSQRMRCPAPTITYGSEVAAPVKNGLIVVGIAISLLFAGCASVDGGQVAAGILQGVGTGLSGL